MNSKKLLSEILSILDMNENNGLIKSDDQNLSYSHQKNFRSSVNNVSLDAVYFIDGESKQSNTPVIYFSAIDSYDEFKIGELHRLSWNMGEAPLLFVVTPAELLVFNNYEFPKKDNNHKYNLEDSLIEKIDLINSVEYKKLDKYSRTNISTGIYWEEHNTRFKVDNRIDSVLIDNLDTMRQMLLENIQDISIVHALLSRVILIKYLEDRTDNYGNKALPNDFFSRFKENSRNFLEVLECKNSTYKLFKFLYDKFNGDVFNLLPNEEKLVSEKDLYIIRSFADGTTKLSSGQMNLWPLYSFDHIPIQLISTIYEMFFQSEVEMSQKTSESIDRKGTFYTPYHLVELLYDEVYPWNIPYTEDFKILDPSCGSGIFLVEGFKRILLKWINRYEAIPDANTMKNLLRTHIYGVDINSDALRIASFSLSLVICDFLEPLYIWDNLEFPSLLETNLYDSDFFNSTDGFNYIEFDLIIGNPPWENKLSIPAQNYLRSSEYLIGDKQIAQLFCWKSLDLLTETGNSCLLLPSKSVLFNISDNNMQFRESFFFRTNVTTILNFTDYSKTLFKNAKFPATAIIFNPRTYDRGTHLIYCSPKINHSIEDHFRFTINPLDIAKIPYDLTGEKYSWKIAMIGGPRDLELIHRLQSSYGNLNNYVEQYDLKISEGFSRGNRKNEYKQFLNYPILAPRRFRAFEINIDELEVNKDPMFERIRTRNPEIYETPHMVIKQSPIKDRIHSSIINFPALFSLSFLGIHGDIRFLKYYSLIINSIVSSYYFMMTSGRWIIERGELEANEFRQFPIPHPNEEILQKSVNLYDRIDKMKTIDYDIIDNFILELYEFKPHEIKLIKDMVKYTFGIYSNKTNKFDNKINHTQIDKYGKTLIEILHNSFGERNSFTFEALTSEDSPLSILIVFINSDNNNGLNTVKSDITSKELLHKLHVLDNKLIEKKSQSLFVRRSLTVYEKDKIYIINPNKEKYWTYSQACRQADELYMRIMMTWREINYDY